MMVISTGEPCETSNFLIVITSFYNLSAGSVLSTLKIRNVYVMSRSHFGRA